jgi:hypothetical protein
MSLQRLRKLDPANAGLLQRKAGKIAPQREQVYGAQRVAQALACAERFITAVAKKIANKIANFIANLLRISHRHSMLSSNEFVCG